MPFSVAYRNDILNYLFSKTTASLSAPSQVYIGLSSNDPEADGGTFTELSGKGYSRVLISQKGATYPDLIGQASGGSISNTKQINWTKATGNWTNAQGFGLFSASSGGTPFYYGKLDTLLEVVEGAVALFDPGALKISFASTDQSAI